MLAKVRAPVTEATVAAFFYAAATYCLLYPLFVAPGSTLYDPAILGSLSLFSLGDIYTVIWVMSWCWRALTTAPFSLFDANIFHPARNVLTSTEHMLGHQLIFGPVLGLSGNPVLANQVNLFACLTLGGLAMYALLRHWGLGRFAALAGGSVFAYAPLRLTFVTHVHLLAGHYLILSLLALDRYLLTGRRHWAAGYAVSLALQCLSSFYLAYMSLVALGGYALAIAATRRQRPELRRLAGAAAATTLALLPFFLLALPYLAVRQTGTLPVEQEQALLRYLSVKLHRLLAVRDEGYYAGTAVVVLAAFGILRWGDAGARVTWARGGALAIAAICIVFGMGPAVELAGREIPMPYSAVAAVVPGFSAMRGPIRFVLVAMVGFAALASFGIDRLMRVDRRLGPLLAGAALAAVAWDYGWLVRHYPVRPVAVGGAVAPIYRTLAELPRGPVLEIPAGGTGEPTEQMRESEYTFQSVFHWQRLLNGRSGYAPPSYTAVMALARALPDEKALDLLRRATGLRYVVVHFKRVPLAQWTQWRSLSGLERPLRLGDAMLFEVAGERDADLLEALLDPLPATTVTGSPLRFLTAGERRAELSVGDAPAHMVSRMLHPVIVQVRNPTETAWPVFTPVEKYRVGIGFRWYDESGALVSERPDAAWLPYDLGPGESLRAPVSVRASVPPGRYRLQIGVTQAGEWFAGTTAERLVEVTGTDATEDQEIRRLRPPSQT